MLLHDTHRFYMKGAQIYPVNENIDYSHSKDDELCAYRRYMDTELKICNTKDHASFNALVPLELEKDVCHEIPLVIEKYCNGAWIEAFKGILNLNDGCFDWDDCCASLTVRPDDIFTCILEAWSEEKNYVEAGTDIEVKCIRGRVECQITSNYNGDASPPPGLGWTALTTNKEYTQEINILDPPLQFNKCTIKYCREVFTGTGIPLGGRWQLDPVTGDYVRSLKVTRCTKTETTSGTQQTNTGTDIDDFVYINQIETCQYLDFESDNGVSFQKLIEFYLGDCACIKSDLFGINPDGTAPTNIAYAFAAQYLQNLAWFQGSDIIVADSDENAISGLKSFKKIWGDLKKMFNLKMIDDGNGCIRWEHVSYNSGGDMIDLTKLDEGKWLEDNYNYCKSQEDYQSRDEWRNHIVANNIDWDGAYAKYALKCSNGETNECETECILTNVTQFYNNDEYLDDDSAMDSIFLLSLDENNDIFSIGGAFSGAPITNGPLSWPILVQNLHLWDRPFTRGTMNDNVYTFFSTKKNKKQGPIEFDMCCDVYYNQFKGDMRVNTQFGKACIEDAAYSEPAGCMTVNLEF